jgi:hypothetical protein
VRVWIFLQAVEHRDWIWGFSPERDCAKLQQQAWQRVHAMGVDRDEAGYCCARNYVAWKACEVVDSDAQLRAEKTFGPPCMCGAGACGTERQAGRADILPAAKGQHVYRM